MDPLTLMLLVSLGTTVIGGTVEGVSKAVSDDKAKINLKEYKRKYKDDYEDLINNLGLSDSDIESFLRNYDESSAATLHQDYVDIAKAGLEYPTAPVFDAKYSDYLTDARSQVDAMYSGMYSDLDKLLANSTDMYNQQMSDISSDYGSLRSNLLSQQYQQNAQLMDTLQSNMDRSRRNALEAGASAGIRIADNINTLLTVQNKQSATSMETANQLAQMMIQQRNAEQSARSAYNEALATDTANRHSLKLSANERASQIADTNYNAAYNDYTVASDKYDRDVTEWDNSLYSNPLYDDRTKIRKSRYSN